MLYFGWEQGSTNSYRNSDCYQHGSMSAKRSQDARYLIPSSSMTSLRNLGCILDRYLVYCKNSGEVCLTECHWPKLLKERPLKNGLLTPMR